MNTPAPYTIGPAKYAGRYAGNAQKAIKCPSDGGYKTRAARLAQALKGRYTSRERAYILSATKAEKFEALYAAGYDANPVTHELIPPTQPAPEPHPVQIAPPTLDEFLKGAAVRYHGLSNSKGVARKYVAVYKSAGHPLGSLKVLEVREADGPNAGRLVMAPIYRDPIYREESARMFFASLGRSIVN